MIETIIISAIILLIAVLFLGVRIFFQKNGKFPNTHIGGSKAMKERGITCATSQDREARKNIKRLNTADVLKDLENELK